MGRILSIFYFEGLGALSQRKKKNISKDANLEIMGQTLEIMTWFPVALQHGG